MIAPVEEPKDWKQGYALDDLKRLAAPFQSFKTYVHGAFGVPKERDVASALVAKSLVVDDEQAPRAAAIVKILKVPGRQQDFRGQTFNIPAGDTVVWDSGIAPDATWARFNSLLDQAWIDGSQCQWVEWYEEDPNRASALVGFQWVATKIMAGSEIKGLYLRARTPEIFAERVRLIAPLTEADRSSIACLAEGFISEDERQGILRELEEAQWAQHYSSYNKRSSWTAFALRGYDPKDPTFIIKPHEMSQRWKSENPTRMQTKPEWTDIAGQFPTARQVVSRLGANFDRVRFMRLAPKGGELTRHADITDRDAGTADGRITRLHIPIATLPSCVFTSWGIRGQQYQRHFSQGSLCYLDQRRPHAVTNPENVDRIHLVVDVVADEGLRQRFTNAVWRCDD